MPPNPLDAAALSPEDVRLRRLIAQTVAALGPVDPAVLPHLVRAQLKGQIGDDVDLAAYLAQPTTYQPRPDPARR